MRRYSIEELRAKAELANRRKLFNVPVDVLKLLALVEAVETLKLLRDSFGPSSLPDAPIHRERMQVAWKQSNAALSRFDFTDADASSEKEN